MTFFTEVKIGLKVKLAEKSSTTKISVRTPQLLKFTFLNYEKLPSGSQNLNSSCSLIMVSIQKKNPHKNPMQNSHFLQSPDFHLEVRKHNKQQMDSAQIIIED